MDRAGELALVERIMAHRSAGNTTDMAPSMYRNPVATYVDPARYDREVERLFRGGPIVACLSSDVTRCGEFVTVSIVDVPLIVVRGDDGRVRAFVNVCRHRGVRVAEGRGQTRSFMCPFHGWSYRLDGRLINPTHRDGFEGLDRGAHGLVSVACDEAGGLVFVHIDGEVGSLDAGAWLGELSTELSGFGLGGFTHVESRASSHAMNWKLMADTFCEQYHLRHLHHASLAPTIQSDNSLYDAVGLHGRMVTPARSIEQLDDQPRDEWKLLSHAVVNYMIVPNTVMLVQEDFVETFQFLPTGADRTISLATMYTLDAPRDDRSRRRLGKAFAFLLDIIDREDYAMCEQTQRSFSAGAQTELVFGRNEPGLIHYHESIESLMGIVPPSRRLGEDSGVPVDLRTLS